MPESNERTAITPALLLARLEAIAAALRDSGAALGLLGLGSVGLERSRLDAYSDLDFFAIVAPGHKARYIERLDWLAAAHPLAWHFQNTVDGHKALMADGVFCEFAVFEAHELAQIPYASGQWVWRSEALDPALANPSMPMPTARLPDERWIVGEALSCLFVGLQRWQRGEKLSAARFVQGHALDRLIELDALRAQATQAQGVPADPFNRERRLERRQPGLAQELPALIPGYADTPAAAIAMLAALERRGALLDPHIRAQVLALASHRESAASA